MFVCFYGTAMQHVSLPMNCEILNDIVGVDVAAKLPYNHG